MKTLVILFADYNSTHMFEKIFEGRSAFERSLDWAKNAVKEGESETIIFAASRIEAECRKSAGSEEIICLENWTVKDLFQNFDSCAKEKNAAHILFSWADQPFINQEITDEIIKTHLEYAAEYTFADGFPEGMAPEMLENGAAAVLAVLASNQKADIGEQSVTRTSVFDLIKTDINSFEVETVIADEDARLFRINFSCSTKANTISCKKAFEMGMEGKSVNEIVESCCKNPAVLKTVPGYYAVQITDNVAAECFYHPDGMEQTGGSKYMALDDFKKIIKSAAEYSETAVVSLSAWGDPTLHPDFVQFVKIVLEEPGLSVLIESDCAGLTEEMCMALQDYGKRIIWLVTLDAFTSETYSRIHAGADFEKAKNRILLLAEYFPSGTYPQFTRMNENENELEAFYRFWSDKNSPTAGLLTIQKYDSCCNSMPDRKPADLSPLERNACWHIRRDMTVLLDGSVPFCRGQLRVNIIGNAFTENLETIFNRLNDEVQNHLNGKYSKTCGACDEYHTFYF